MNYTQKSEGFTIIEILVVMGLIAILATIVLIALNPSRHFAQARNTQRTSNVAEMLNAVGENMAEHNGQFDCVAGALPQTPLQMSADTSDYNIAGCLSPTYLSTLPWDPTGPNASYNGPTDYHTGYTIMQDPVTNRITIAAPHAELGQTISLTR